MKQEIINSIDCCINNLQFIKEAIIEDKDMNQVDPLDLLVFNVIGHDHIYTQMAALYNITED